MSTATDVGVMTFTEITERMDFHLACEHSSHSTQTTLHRGDAAWVQSRAALPCCGCELVARLVCDKWVQSCKSGAVRLHCASCGTPYSHDAYKDLISWVKL